MALFLDIAQDSINKKNEELCGDNVEIRQNDESTTILLADGLGSGVKANILATMTSTIAATMLEDKLSITDVVETLEATLPECQVRKLAYSTFTIVQIFKQTREVYIVEFDNPPLVYIRDGEILELPRKPLRFKGKDIFETSLKIEEGDIIGFFSDGVIHAGVGNLIDFGWQWEEAADYFLARAYDETMMTSKDISMKMIDICNDLYDGQPGDDTTCVVVRAEEHRYVTLFSGPPLDRTKDSMIKEIFDEAKGKKVVCGGTASNIVSREYGEEINIDLSTMSQEVPPVGSMPSIDLITEGVITIQETVRIIREYIDKREGNKAFKGNNGAEILADTLVNYATHIDFILGNSINPAHQNPDFPDALTSKWKITQELINLLKELNKAVNIIYI
ncbi:MAG: PP2C family protein-serine/threonine phosphatase [Eubacteriaceae bacterium]|nr:PP2C family protein-serine/threonine phosphatase [Eubacteriaceae bacterium]MDD4507733.1 PP2C family protein-serine/threonine phosphatase [Eubacteriaceae bacterium]